MLSETITSLAVQNRENIDVGRDSPASGFGVVRLNQKGA